jgi:penicillin amidase
MVGALVRGTLKVIATLLLLVAVLAAGLALHVWLAARGSLPALEGEVAMPGLSAPLSIARDETGMPTITSSTRQDAAVALGFLHAQERFFQMDLLRRSAAGELGELLGGAVFSLDRAMRVHRFRARARALFAQMAPDERALVEAYTDGVNRGLQGLGRQPFEYALLLARPRAWLPEDTMLVVFAMYLNLQPATPQREMDRALATRRGGVALADFLYPDGAPNDAPLDGSIMPEPAMPARLEPVEPGSALPAPAPAMGPAPAEDPVPGSNNWAVAGALTATGAALVANDMHLGTRLPNTWYRARIVVRGTDDGAGDALDIVGATLPGTPMMVVGSNGRVAWGFTNSYIDTADAVIVETGDGGAIYRTPAGPQPFRLHEEEICGRLRCETLEVRETIWGPVVGEDALGRTIAMRWTAHEPGAVRLAPALALERADTVEEAIAIAQRSAIPQQNLVVGDAAGAIAWTIIGQVPDRFGFDGRDAVSFADGSRGWRGTLSPGAVPIWRTPEDGRIWTANGRVLGNEGATLLGNGGWDHGGRSERIRNLLRAQERFAPQDFLRIQIDVLSTVHLWWREALLAELAARTGDPALAAMAAPVRAWDGRATPDSVGARLVTRYREIVRDRVFAGLMGGAPEGGFRRTYATGGAEGSLRRLLAERPPELVPEGHDSWDTLIDQALRELAGEVQDKARGRIERFTWGAINTAGVRHPLAQLVPLLGLWTDPEDVPVPGDRATVRATAPGFGASQRMAVSPGHEADGLFHMPGGQAGNPLSPYYLAGHADWVAGRPTPLLPGPTRWSLTLSPGG